MDPVNQQRDDTPTHLSSPLKELTVLIRDENNVQVPHVLPYLQIMTYPKWKADIIKKKIIDGIINERNLKYVTPEERKKLEEEVEVTL